MLHKNALQNSHPEAALYFDNTKEKQSAEEMINFGYLKKLSGINAYIANGVTYHNWLDTQITKACKVIAQIRYGRKKNGYIFVFTSNGKMLAGRGQTNISPEFSRFAEKKFIEEKTEISELIKEGKDSFFISYKYPKPKFEKSGNSTITAGAKSAKEMAANNNIEKYSFIHMIRKYNVLVGAGVYSDDIDSQLTESRKTLKNWINWQVGMIILASIACSLIAVLGFTIIFRRIQNGFNKFIDFFSKASKEAIRIPRENFYYNEFKLLADSANRMIEQWSSAEKELKKHHTNLEALVTARTEALENSERQYRELYNSSVIGLFQLSVDGKILKANKMAANMLGYEEPEDIILKCKFSDIMEKNYRKEFLLKILDNGGINDFEVSLNTPENKELIVSISAKLIHSENIINGSMLNITSRILSERALIRSERFAAVGTLAGGVAHEFNNINTSVLGYAELGLISSDISQETLQYFDKIKNATLRAKSITRGLLSFSGEMEQVMKMSNMTESVNDIIGLLRREFTSTGIKLKTSFTDVPDTLMDSNQIGQVVLNLMINAAHALEKSKNKEIEISTGQNKNEVWVSVKDNGCGIPEDNIDKIFLPFFSTKGEHSQSSEEASEINGTGLGLSVSESIARQHNGELHVESELGTGTTFTLKIPIVTGLFGNGTEIFLQKSLESDKNILVIDDEPDICDILEIYLTKLECNVFATDDGSKALELVKRGEIGLILLDMQMPKMPGTDFLDELEKLEKNKQPKVIVITGRNEIFNNCFENYNCVCDILPKPFNLDNVVEKVGNLIEIKNPIGSVLANA
jgi:PAS domain S-box-containing protein